MSLQKKMISLVLSLNLIMDLLPTWLQMRDYKYQQALSLWPWWTPHHCTASLYSTLHNHYISPQYSVCYRHSRPILHRPNLKHSSDNIIAHIITYFYTTLSLCHALQQAHITNCYRHFCNKQDLIDIGSDQWQKEREMAAWKANWCTVTHLHA